MYKYLIKRLFFLFPPETIHHLVFKTLKTLFRIPGVPGVVSSIYTVRDPRLKRTVFGLEFSNPVGLAAGFDKDAKLFDELGCMGFGFVEIGTLTPVGQPGNPKPRLFRLPQDEALINRMGFNNEGVEAAVKRLKKRRSGILIGGNIGKNKVTPNEQALDDYLKCFKALYPYVDYFVVNVSSPNTPNLRELQEKDKLDALLGGLMEVNRKEHKPKPILLKIAPDLTDGQLQDIVYVVKRNELSGVIATNTTISREGLTTNKQSLERIGAGGVSGKPVNQRATEIIKYLSGNLGPDYPIIGVGGIHSPEDALEKLRAGASLVQIYTGFIYEGPTLIKRINKAIIDKLPVS